MKKEGVKGPYQYRPCIDCGQPARHTQRSKGRCRACDNAHREAPHGTETRYKRCRCALCRTAANAARKRRRHERAADV